MQRVGDYIIVDMLGENPSTNSEVYLVYHHTFENHEPDQRTHYVMKTIKIGNAREQEQTNKILWAEYAAAQKLQHSNLVKYYDYKEDVTHTRFEGT